MPRAIRWLLVPVTGAAVWFATLLLGIGLITMLDSLCPPELMESGSCRTWWYRPASTVVEIGCAVIAATGFVILPAAVAPAHRFSVAVASFTIGAIFTTNLAIAGATWGAFWAAGLSGLAALFFVGRRSSKGSPTTGL